MKLRPVLLVVLILSGFYYATTHGSTTGRLMPWLRSPVETNERLQLASLATAQGPVGAFHLVEASAAPAFDGEEQQNIAVYRKALPSVVNITSTAVAFDFFNRPVPQQGMGSGFILDKQGHILTNNHVIDNAQRVEVTLGDKHKYKATVVGIDKQHDLALLQINAPNLVPATLSESNGLMVGQRVYAIGNPFGLSGTLTRGIISMASYGQSAAHCRQPTQISSSTCDGAGLSLVRRVNSGTNANATNASVPSASASPPCIARVTGTQNA